ncbi:hypothetical protein BDZ97DRAFT_1753221 [Flammula alnicola]|nr:hypothetical protein BDZ97DRAFT_1753221 [Flammula alnicola]
MAALLHFLAAVLSFFFAFPTVDAFTFSFGSTPSQCDNLPLTWTGGTPPFQLLIVPIFGTPRNVSIPSSAFSNGQGSYPLQIPLPKGQQMVLTMSDATGFNAGGTSNVLTVQASQGGSCNTTDPGVAFSFQLNDALQQCRPFTFSGYIASGATQPVTVAAIIPGGNVLTLFPPVGSDNFLWDAAVARGTSMIFMMTDAQGRPGGSSDVRIVNSSDDNTCLVSNSPSSTANPPSPATTASPSSTSSSATTTPSSPPSNGFSIAAIAGTVIGALLFLAVVITLGLFFLRRRHDASLAGNGGDPFRRQSQRVGSRMDLTYDPPPGTYGLQPPLNSGPAATPYPYSPGLIAPLASNPFFDSPSPSQHQLSPSQYDASTQYADSRYQLSEADQYEMPLQPQHPGPYQSLPQIYPPPPNYPPLNRPMDPFNAASPPMLPGTEIEPFTMEASTSRDSMSTAQRKVAMAGATTYKPSRFMVHTDVEDVLPPPNEDGVIELPPQYSERHGTLGVANPTSPAPGASAGPPPGAWHSS